MTAPQLYTFDEAAALLKVSVHTLKRGAYERRLPHTRIGRHVRFSDADLAAIVAAGQQTPSKAAVTPLRRTS